MKLGGNADDPHLQHRPLGAAIALPRRRPLPAFTGSSILERRRVPEHHQPARHELVDTCGIGEPGARDPGAAGGAGLLHPQAQRHQAGQDAVRLGGKEIPDVGADVRVRVRDETHGPWRPGKGLLDDP
jgi:hypothetical protein